MRSRRSGFDRRSQVVLDIGEDERVELRRSLGLSPREMQIAAAVLDGRSDKEIAVTLGISANTVHTHLERIFRGLHVRNRLGLAVLLVTEHARLRKRLARERGASDA